LPEAEHVKHAGLGYTKKKKLLGLETEFFIFDDVTTLPTL